MRLRFCIDKEGQPKQYLTEYVFKNIKNIPVDTKEDEKKCTQALINTPFNLIDSELFSINIFKYPDGHGGFNANFHHLVSDAWTMSLFLNEVISYYSCLIHGKELDLNPFPSYVDYIAQEKEYTDSKRFQKDKEFWNELFDSEPIFSRISSEATSSLSTASKRISFELPSNLYTQINELCQKYKCSIYTFFMAIYSIYIAKLNNNRSPIVGTPVLNRSNFKEKHTSGMFISTVPFKTTFSAEQSFSSYLQDVALTQLSIFRHQKYPYDVLLKDIKEKFSISENLYDLVLSYQNARDDSQSSDVEYSSNWLFSGHVSNSLEIHFYDMDNTGTLNMFYDYQLDKFSEADIHSLHSRIIEMTNMVLNNSEICIKDIPIITKEEQEKFLGDFNFTGFDYDKELSLTKIFESNAQNFPNKTAVIFEDQKLTYAELNNRANVIAEKLITSSVTKNDIVGIMLNRSIDLLPAVWGVLKAGATYMLIDPALPADRINYMLSNSSSPLLITSRDMELEFENKLYLDAIDFNKEVSNPDIASSNEDGFCVIYTSGSTGTPKGVMLNQVGLANMAKAMTKVLDYLKEGNKHTLVSVTSTPFDIFVYEIIVSLTHGLKVVMANNAEHRNPKLLDALIRKYNVDVMTVTPSLMKINYDNREPDTALAQVKNMVFGGEPLPEKFVKDLRALSDDITIYNIYGPSEITVLSNVQNLDNEKEITVGPPILNTQMYILDSDMKQVPIGVIGEIYIAGIQVGEGYIGKKELTEQRFLNNPFGPGKIYKSGDIGRWTFDGKIQCLGRIDNQIKLRGLRIELSEIEDEIAKMPGVSSCVVNKITLDNKECLCAYYVCDTDLTEQQIKENLRKFLPQYMIPTHVVKLDSMPYTINRKIDRKALPLPKVTHLVDSGHIDISSLNSNEEKLTQIWKSILKVDNIDVNGNFFDIGGDSISAINMQIEALKYGLEFEYADIFNYPTIRQLSKKLPSPEEKFMSNYNYSKIDKILQNNCVENIKNISKYDVKNILLIGGTGYLGAHIISTFLKNETGIVYCLIRQKNNESPLYRINRRLEFYFGKNFLNKYSNRIKVIKGDITSKNLCLTDENYSNLIKNIDTVINAGAIVKHFGQKEEYENINVLGTKNVIEFCTRNKKRLLHISTMSVSGFGEKEEFSNNIYFEDYEIKFQVIENNGKEKFPKNDLIKLFDYDKIKRDILIRHRNEL